MTALNETAYPRLNPEPSPKELKDSFTPTAGELALVAGMAGIASRPISRAATLMHLKIFQRLGQFCSVANVPLVIREHIAQQAGMAVRPTQKDLKQFESSGSYRIMLKALRKHLNVRPLAVADHAWLEVVAAAAADTKHAVTDVINVMLEELVALAARLVGEVGGVVSPLPLDPLPFTSTPAIAHFIPVGAVRPIVLFPAAPAFA